MQLLVPFLTWLVYFGLSVGAILIDGKMQRAKAEREGGVDFMERSPWGYIALGVLCGPLPVIVYFGTTRKGAIGWLIGLGIAVLIYLMTVVASTVLTLAFAGAGVR